MREKSTIAVRVFTVTVFFLLLPCISYVVPPAAAQKAAPQVQAAPSAAQSLLNPNAPPQGSITIKSPASGGTWHQGGRSEIQWTCNGTRSNLVRVTLWKDGKQFAVIGTGVASDHTFYVIPPDTAVGNYELRVTLEADTRIEARQPVTVNPRVTWSLHSISGTVMGSGKAVSGVNVTLQVTGSASASQVRTAITDSAGKYIFAGLSDGSYNLSITGPQYIGDPSWATVKVNGADATQNFTAWTSYSISGTVKTSAGAPISAQLSWPGGVAGTYPDGSYNIGYLYDGIKITITPSAPGYTFNPASLTITIKGASVTGQNFTAMLNRSISGTVKTSSGAALPGVGISLGSAYGQQSASTDSSGNYTLTNLSNGSTYTITPTLIGYAFNPANTTAKVDNADVVGQNFTASVASSLHSISGTVISGTLTGSGKAVSGVNVTLQVTGSTSASQVRTAITDSAGKYIFAGLSDGSYTLSITGTQYIGNPSWTTVKVNGADATQNFTAWTSYSISGTVKTSAGAPIDTLLSFPGGVAGTHPDSSYNIGYLSDGTKITITPSAPGYTFNPASLTITIKGASVTGQNFVGVCQDSTKCK